VTRKIFVGDTDRNEVQSAETWQAYGRDYDDRDRRSRADDRPRRRRRLLRALGEDERAAHLRVLGIASRRGRMDRGRLGCEEQDRQRWRRRRRPLRFGKPRRTDALVAEAKRIAVTKDADLCGNAAPDAALEKIREASDIMQDGTQDPSKECDGISLGLGFEMTRVVIGTAAAPVAAPANPCP
jgi:hypothetical protein